VATFGAISNDIAVVVDSSGIGENPAGSLSNKAVEVRHYPIAVEERMLLTFAPTRLSDDLVGVVDARTITVAVVRLPEGAQVSHLPATVEEGS
jgi:hypothetical protein